MLAGDPGADDIDEPGQAVTRAIDDGKMHEAATAAGQSGSDKVRRDEEDHR
jgi:hypothetical protein